MRIVLERRESSWEWAWTANWLQDGDALDAELGKVGRA